jgi:hypothetical protein
MLALLTGSSLVYGDDSPLAAAPETPSPAVDTAAGDPLPGKINVIFDIAPRQDKGKLYFEVETNLPDGMRFMVAIRDEYGFICKVGSTMERIDMDIVNGRMAIGPFPFHGQTFPSGEYKFYMNSYPDEDQPKNIINVIGKNGANLTGPDVINGTVVLAKEFMITGTD